MPVEKEKSYVFTKSNLNQLFDKLASNSNVAKDPILITDQYLNRETRIRSSSHGKTNEHEVTQKSGNEKEHRIENTVKVDYQQICFMKPLVKLTVHKKRYTLVDTDEFIVTLDDVVSPLNLVIVEIEAKHHSYNIPSLEHIINTKEHFIECPLSAWDFYKRKIGICGGPSSGKTQLSKYLSYTINTEFCGNSYNTEEYATSFIQKYDKIPSIYDQLIITPKQENRERCAASKHDIVITDSPVFLGYIYACINNNKTICCDTKLLLKYLHEIALNSFERYDNLIFMEQPQEYIHNNIRYNDKNFAIAVSNKIKNLLDNYKVPFRAYNYQDKDKILKDLFYINDKIQ